MRRFLSVAVLTFTASAANLTAQADPDRPVAGAGGGGVIPAGWHVRAGTNRQTGQPARLDNVKFASMGDGMHTTVGPAAIYWRDRDTVSGNYHVVAELSQMKNPAHPEAFGILIGGKRHPQLRERY